MCVCLDCGSLNKQIIQTIDAKQRKKNCITTDVTAFKNTHHFLIIKNGIVTLSDKSILFPNDYDKCITELISHKIIHQEFSEQFQQFYDNKLYDKLIGNPVTVRIRSKIDVRNTKFIQLTQKLFHNSLYSSLNDYTKISFHDCTWKKNHKDGSHHIKLKYIKGIIVPNE